MIPLQAHLSNSDSSALNSYCEHIQSGIQTLLVVRVEASSKTSGKMKFSFGLIFDLLFLSVCFENGADAVPGTGPRVWTPSPRTAVDVKTIDAARLLEFNERRSPRRNSCIGSRLLSYHGTLFAYIANVENFLE